MRRLIWPLVLVAALLLVLVSAYRDPATQRFLSPSPSPRPTASAAPSLPVQVQSEFCATQRFGCKSITVIGQAGPLQYFDGTAIVIASVYAIVQEQDRPDGVYTFAWLIYVDDQGKFIGEE